MPSHVVSGKVNSAYLSNMLGGFAKQKPKKRIVILSGAGISAESGLKTFRDSDGLWEEHDVRDVATPEGWRRNPALVIDFYNQRRKQVLEAKPNDAHKALARLEKKFDVQIITQNIDDLHERGGSKNVIHLHGEIRKVRSTIDPSLVYELKSWQMKPDAVCELGSPLRPHIVWFGEPVPMMEEAAVIATTADCFIVVGTSLNVYPAAGLIDVAPPQIQKFIVDPNDINRGLSASTEHIREKAGTGIPALVERLMKNEALVF